MKAIFDEVGGTYAIDGAAVEAVQVKGAAEAVIAQTQGEMAKLADRLAAGQIEVQEFYDSFKRETKYLHMAQAALARGGFDRMGDADWRRVEKIVEQQWSGVEGQFPGLYSFAQDVQNGRYGTQELRRGFNSRARAYADAGRATYENERLAGRIESGPLEAKREKGAADHCDDCNRWAALGWIDARTMFERYPIGASVCNVECNCGIVTRRAKVENQIKNLLQTFIRIAAPVATVATIAANLVFLVLRARYGAVLLDAGKIGTLAKTGPVNYESAQAEVEAFRGIVKSKLPTPSFLERDPLRLKSRIELGGANATLKPTGVIELADDLGADDVVRAEALLREVIHSHTAGYTRASASDLLARNIEEGLNESLGRILREQVHNQAGFKFTLADFTRRDANHPFNKFVGAWDEICQKKGITEDGKLDFYIQVLQIPIAERPKWLKAQLGVRDFAFIIGKFR